MAVSEADRYDTFVTRTLSEVQEGLKLDNGQDGSCKKRVCNALEKRTTTRVGKSRNAAQKVIEGRFILGGDDASYLASGLAMLWSTVGTPVPSNGGQELSLAPAALYSPDAVNGIHRGLVAAMEKRNQEMRKDAPGALSNLMKALVPLLPFLHYEDVDAEFLTKQEITNVQDRNKLFKFLVDAKQKLNADTTGGAHIPSSSLAFKILDEATKAHETAIEAQKKAAQETLKTEKNRCAQDVQTLVTEIGDRDNKINQLNINIEYLDNRVQQQRATFNSSKKDQERAIGELTTKIGALTKEREDRDIALQGLENHLREVNEAKTTADGRIIALNTQVEGLTADRTRKQNDELEARDVAEKEVEELNRKIAALKAAGTQKDAELANVQSQLEETKHRCVQDVQTLVTDIGDRDNQINQLDINIEYLDNRVQQQRAELEACKKDKEIAVDGATEATELVMKLMNQLNVANKMVTDLSEQLNVANKTVTELSEQQDAQAGAQAEERLAQLQADLFDAKAKAKKCEEALATDRAALAECESEVKRLTAEAVELRTGLAACKEDLEVAQKACQASVDLFEEQTEALQVRNKALTEYRRLARLYQQTKQIRDVHATNIVQAGGNLNAAGSKFNVAEETVAIAEANKRLNDISAQMVDLNNKLLALGIKPLADDDDDPSYVDFPQLNSEEQKLLTTARKYKKEAEDRRDEIQNQIKEKQDTLADMNKTTPYNQALYPQEYDDLSSKLVDLQATLQRVVLRIAQFGEAIQATEKNIDGTDTHMASSGDAWIATAVFRGLVGQRGPTEPAHVAHCPQDALLPYALPDVKQVVKHLLPAHLLLQSTPEPTAADLERAMGACAACEHADKRQRCATDVTSPATTSEALVLFEDDFAITGEVPAAELSAERHGVEMPHEVRWMPQGPRARTMARVAVMEHAVARCAQLAAKADVHPDVAAALRHAGAALKLQQLAPLYELYAAVENCDDPHPLGTGGRRLVTRPCAVVRGTLSFPVDAGVAPLTKAHVANTNDKPLTQDASLSQAMGKTAMQTATLRNDLRKRGLAHNVYVAPAAHELAFRSAPTGVNDPNINRAVAAERAAGGQAAGQIAAARETTTKTPLPDAAAPAPAPMTNNRASADLYRDDTFVRIINRLIVAAAAIKVTGDGNNDEPPDPVAAFLEASNPSKTGEGLVTPQTRREGLWAEMHRNVAISQDRLWIFVRLMSGKIGGNVSEVITLADEATLKAAKAIQEQRLEVSKRVSDMQAKIVETVVASMLKNSRMTMEYVEKGDDKNLAVIDADARKDLKDLETGASGRPFFEANVALKNLTIPNGAPPKLKEVLSGLADVGVQMQSTLEQTLAEPGAASASLIELSHPSNSYFVSMRPDAVAAIREAQEKLNCELGAVGSSRRLMLWELVEGGCSVLVQRFAELCGYLLVQARTSTGVSAMYVSHQSIYTNASQARVSLARLTAAACAYTARVAVPEFYDDNPETARFATLTQGEQVRDIDITARRVTVPTASLYAPFSSSGWVNQGGRWSS